MAINIKKAKDIAKDHYAKAMVYGLSGVEKTRTLATAPKPLIMSAEKGTLSLADKDVDIVEVSTPEQIDAVYRACVNGEYKGQYETLCLDSLSEIAEILIDSIAKNSGNKDGRKNYAELASAMLPMIRKFRDINMNVIFICKCKIVHDEDSGSIFWQPMLPGQILPAQIAYLFDEVFCQQKTKAGEVFLQTVADHQRTCKDRSGKLAKNERPDWTAIFNKIKGV